MVEDSGLTVSTVWNAALECGNGVLPRCRLVKMIGYRGLSYKWDGVDLEATVLAHGIEIGPKHEE